MRVLDRNHYDALIEVFSIGIGRAAAALNDIVGSHVHLSLPELRVYRVDELHKALPGFAGKPLNMVNMAFSGAFTGTSGLIVLEEDAPALVATLAGDHADATMLDEMRVGALVEIGNILLNAVHGSIANGVEGHLEYSVPDFVEDTLENLFDSTIQPDSEVILATVNLEVERLKIAAEIITVLELATVEELTDALHRTFAGA